MTSTKSSQSSVLLIHNEHQDTLAITTGVHKDRNRDIAMDPTNPKPTAKRKANEDFNPLLNPSKKSKKEVRDFIILLSCALGELISYVCISLEVKRVE